MEGHDAALEPLTGQLFEVHQVLNDEDVCSHEQLMERTWDLIGSERIDTDDIYFLIHQFTGRPFRYQRGIPEVISVVRLLAVPGQEENDISLSDLAEIGNYLALPSHIEDHGLPYELLQRIVRKCFSSLDHVQGRIDMRGKMGVETQAFHVPTVIFDGCDLFCLVGGIAGEYGSFFVDGHGEIDDHGIG